MHDAIMVHAMDLLVTPNEWQRKLAAQRATNENTLHSRAHDRMMKFRSKPTPSCPLSIINLIESW